MTQQRRFYITTAIPYANGAPHIGHAYERIATDAIARFMRLDGRDVLFVTGMDEHGLKMQQTAAREGITAQALADRTAAQFEAMGALLNARADDIVRTTERRHKRASQAIWELMEANGDVYLSKYSGWYSVRDEAYFDEDELTGGPDGTRLAPSGAPAEWVEEESYFFRLSAYADRLLAHYEAHPGFVTPDKYRNEIKAFVKRGLSDLSISRTTFDWGVPVPGDARHVMYVWVDALTNYITATGFPDGGPRTDFWPANAHVIGKDITRFHAIYWPAFLMSARLATPRQIVVHGFLFNRGEKMSKSTGNVVDPATLVERYGVDQVRYFFLREVPFGQDGNYSHEAIVQRINADLANDLGNLAQRSLSMIARNCAGAVPDWRSFGLVAGESRELLEQADSLIGVAREYMEGYAIHLYLAAVFDVVARANRYFANHEPWKLAKIDPGRMRVVLYVTIETLRMVAILLQPVMPAAMGKLLDLLAVAPHERDFAALDDGGESGLIEARKRLRPGSALPPPSPIFPRHVEPEAEAP
ncbi:MAG: methionine--tRNA ligase [Roseiarcus sp.]